MSWVIDWEAIWKVVFIALISAFGLMSLLVTVKGAGDIKRLLTLLQNEEAAAAEEVNDVPKQP